MISIHEHSHGNHGYTVEILAIDTNDKPFIGRTLDDFQVIFMVYIQGFI
jgi:hypothetical protein